MIRGTRRTGGSSLTNLGAGTPSHRRASCSLIGGGVDGRGSSCASGCGACETETATANAFAIATITPSAGSAITPSAGSVLVGMHWLGSLGALHRVDPTGAKDLLVVCSPKPAQTQASPELANLDSSQLRPKPAQIFWRLRPKPA